MEHVKILTESDPSRARQQSRSVKDSASELLNEPELGLISSDFVESTNSVGLCFPLGDSLSLSLEDDIEVHTEDTSGGVILDSEINMLINTKSEVACIYNNK